MMRALTFLTSMSRQATASAMVDHVSQSLLLSGERGPTQVGVSLEIAQLLVSGVGSALRCHQTYVNGAGEAYLGYAEDGLVPHDDVGSALSRWANASVDSCKVKWATRS